MDVHAIVEMLDPDWHEHFVDVWQAFEHYEKYADPEQFIEAIREIEGDEGVREYLAERADHGT